MAKKREGNEPVQSGVERWTRFLGAATRFLWIIVVVVLLALVGRWLFFRGSGLDTRPKIQTKPMVARVDWSRVDAEVARVLQKGRTAAEAFAGQHLDEWIAANMERVDG